MNYVVQTKSSSACDLKFSTEYSIKLPNACFTLAFLVKWRYYVQFYHNDSSNESVWEISKFRVAS